MQTVEQRHIEAAQRYFGYPLAPADAAHVIDAATHFARFEASLPPSAPVDRDAVERMRAVAEGGTINGTYKMPPFASLQVFRGDLLDLIAALALPPSGIAEMVRALQPFSDALGDVAEHDREKWPDDQTIEHDGFPEYITVGDLRRARSAIRSLGLSKAAA